MLPMTRLTMQVEMLNGQITAIDMDLLRNFIIYMNMRIVAIPLPLIPPPFQLYMRLLSPIAITTPNLLLFRLRHSQL